MGGEDRLEVQVNSARRWGHAIWRGFLGFGRLIVAWVPSLLLLVFGIAYLMSCLELLAAPGTGFDFTYGSRSGAIRVTAESYGVDPITQTLTAMGVSVRDAKGMEIASARKAVVRLKNGVPQVDLRSAEATLVRRKDGALSLFDLLPADDPNAPLPKFAIKLDRALVRVVDETATPSLTQRLELRNLTVDAANGLIYAKSGASLTDAGDLNLAARIQLENGKENLPFEYRLDLTTGRVNLVPIQPLIRRWVPEENKKVLRDLFADEFIVKGNAQVIGTEKTLDRLEADLDATASGLSYPDTLSNAEVTADLVLRGSRLAVVAQSREPGRTATYDGVLDWEREFRSVGNVTAQVDSSARLWPLAARTLPRDIRATGLSTQGRLSTEGARVEWSGPASIQSLTAQGQSFTGISLNLTTDGRLLTAKLNQSRWQGTTLVGSLGVTLGTGALAGAIELPAGQTLRIARNFGANRLELDLAGRALITGSLKKPEVVVNATGGGTLQRPDAPTLILGSLEARLRWANGLATIERGVLIGRNGVIAADGTVDTAKQTLNLDLEAGGVDLGPWNSVVRGVGYAAGRLTGPWSNPEFRGTATAYNVRKDKLSIPRVRASIVANAQTVTASEIEGALGLGVLSGQVTLGLDDLSLAGNLTANEIFLTDLIPVEGLVGRFDVESSTVSGTAEKPVLSFIATSKEMNLQGVDIENVRLEGGFAEGVLNLEAGTANLGEGTAKLTAKFNPESRKGEFTLVSNEVPLDRLALKSEDLEVTGTGSLSGQGTFELPAEGDQFDPKKPVLFGSFNLQLQGATVNEFNAGSGSFALTSTTTAVSISGGVAAIGGDLQDVGLLELDDLTYEWSTENLSGFALASNVPVDGLIRAIRNQIKIDDVQIQRIIRGLDGKASATLAFGGTLGKPRLDLESARVVDLGSLGQNLGDVAFGALIEPGNVELRRLMWRMGEGQAMASGRATLNEKNEITEATLAGEIVKLNPAPLLGLLEDTPQLEASINSTFVMNQQGKAITGRASLNADSFATRGNDGTINTINGSISSDEIVLEDEVITANGLWRWEGLQGLIQSRIPLNALAKEGEAKEDAEINLSLPARDVSELRRFLEPPIDPTKQVQEVSALDFNRTAGTIEGMLSAKGRTGAWQVNGKATWLPNQNGVSRLALNDMETALESLEMVIDVANLRNISGSVKGTSSLGGRLLGTVRADLSALLDEGFSRESLLDSRLSGEISLESFGVKEKLKLAKPPTPTGEVTYAVAKDPTTGEANGKITLGGTFESPEIAGTVEVNNLKINLPPEFPESTPKEPGAVIPMFKDLVVILNPGTELNLPVGKLKLEGRSEITGSLESVSIRAPFRVESGTILLPASRVNLEGGTVVITAGIGGNPRVDVNLEGRTVVTVRQTADRFESYTLNLEIRGDLLDPQGINISGTSDPPDLTTEQIQAIVGQREFLESLVRSAIGESSRNDLRDSLFTLALPSLTQGLTAQFAEALSLDYLLLDYNPFDGAIIRGGKTLGKGLILEASRQVTRIDNRELRYDVRLSYRPPTRDRFLSRVRFTFGFDEKVPWRAGLSWSTKF